jgi:hypothetical protein
MTPRKGLGFRAARRVYRRFFELPLWWFLAKVKEFFFAETLERLALVEARLARIEEHLRGIQASTPAQWDALEQLIFAVLRQPTQDGASSVGVTGILHTAAQSKSPELNSVNGSETLR